MIKIREAVIYLIVAFYMDSSGCGIVFVPRRVALQFAGNPCCKSRKAVAFKGKLPQYFCLLLQGMKGIRRSK